MSAYLVKLLHVEDDPIQQRLIAHHLKAITEYAFAITSVVSEELAMECFQKEKFDQVLLDYQLVQGNGLHLLGRLRALDPIIPIIAISGVATSDIAAELVIAGADDYINKRELTSANLATSIRASLRRAAAVRSKMASQETGNATRLTAQLTDLCVEYLRRMGPDFLARLDAVALELRQANISASELQSLHANAAACLEAAVGLDQGLTQRLARPLLIELLVRVYDEPA